MKPTRGRSSTISASCSRSRTSTRRRSRPMSVRATRAARLGSVRTSRSPRKTRKPTSSTGTSRNLSASARNSAGNSKRSPERRTSRRAGRSQRPRTSTVHTGYGGVLGWAAACLVLSPAAFAERPRPTTAPAIPKPLGGRVRTNGGRRTKRRTSRLWWRRYGGVDHRSGSPGTRRAASGQPACGAGSPGRLEVRRCRVKLS